MNYRHLYHAGNFADVFKHIVLLLLLDYLRQKEKPFFVLDTHAGIGLYDLDSVEAKKTGEAAAGIRRLWSRADVPPAIQPYLDAIRRINPGGALRFYPGSPLLIADALRDNDRFTASELHPDDYATLCGNLGRDPRVRTIEADGYITLRASLPPAERRGLILIDPPFELRNEFDLLVKAVREGYKRFATGTYVLWYPVKDDAVVAAFHQSLIETGIPRILAAHFHRESAKDAVKDPLKLTEKMSGTGMVIINPPWTLKADLESIGAYLSKALVEEGRAWLEITELAGEA